MRAKTCCFLAFNQACQAEVDFPLCPGKWVHSKRLSSGRYQPLQIRTLQRGMRKIRASLLETYEEQWQEEVIRGSSPPPVELYASSEKLRSESRHPAAWHRT